MSKFSISLSDERRNELTEWYDEILNKNFRYIAVMPRRCLNLLEALSDSIEGYNEDKRVLTDQGLLLKSAEIAAYYVEKGALPGIAVVDELIVHGRAFGGFLTRFYAALLWQLDRIMEQKDREKINRAEFWNVFHRSICVFAFYENAEPMILREEYQWRLSYKHIGPSSEWRKFSLGATNEILRKGIANSSYIVSASTEKVIEFDAKKLEKRWIEIKDDSGTSSFGGKLYLDKCADWEKAICPCVRVYRQPNHPEKVFLIPYFFAGSINLEQGKEILNRLKKESDRLVGKQAEALIHICSLAYTCLEIDGRVKIDEEETVDIGEYFAISFFQIIALLLAQITLDRFLLDSGCTRDKTGMWNELEFDARKIARNFGNIVRCSDGKNWLVQEALDTLTTISWDPAIWGYLYATLGGNTQYKKQSESRPDSKLIHDKLCKELYDIAVNHEYKAQKIALEFAMNNNIAVDSLDEAEYDRYEDLLKKVLVESANKTVLPPDLNNIGLFLLYLTEKMDQGDAALKVLAERQDGQMGGMCGTAIIQTTENALSIVPRLMGNHFSSLARLARYFSASSILDKVEVIFREDEESEKCLPWARIMAKNLQKHPDLANALFDWTGISGK